MKLIWLRLGQEILIGEVADRSLVIDLVHERTLTLQNPMMLQYVNVPAPQVLHGKSPT